MSLDVYLTSPATEHECTCSECGNKHSSVKEEEDYWANITHNLGAMAQEAGIYKALWRPEEIDVTTAAQLTPLLITGLQLLESDPPRFKKHNSPNGWGMYEHFVPFVRKYLEACLRSPGATVRVSR